MAGKWLPLKFVEIESGRGGIVLEAILTGTACRR
jgi:hypothetical protein